MLSVLIPIFNFDTTHLVNNLHKQLVSENIEFEIILLDDRSEDSFKKKNSILKNLDRVIYDELPENIGRARIRNELARRAIYDYLLFLDCDSKILNPDFCKKYIDNCIEENVVCGGRVYPSFEPLENELKLHWEYGRRKESIHVDIRKSKPYKSFMTNNFLIAKSIFSKIKFDEKITSYGHEDTLFGYFLQLKNIPVVHIYNPVIHDGLISADVFLLKTKNALKNLAYLYELYNEDYRFIKNVKILLFYYQTRKLGMIWVIKIFNKIFINYLYKKLMGKRPKLFLLSIFKYFYFTNSIRTKNYKL